MNLTFLILAIAPLLLSLISLMEKRVFAHGDFAAALIASLVAGIVTSALMMVQYALGLLSYNIGEISSEAIRIAQYVLNFTFSFAGLVLYQYLNLKFPNNYLQRYSLALSNFLLGLCIAFLFFAYVKWYTVSIFATLLILLLLIEYVGQLRFMYRAYRAFAVMLIPFYVIYGVLFWSSYISVAESHLSGMYIAKIPIENHFLMLGMMLLSIYVFEFLKARKKA